MDEINRKLAEANARLEAVLQTLNILSQADEADAQAALKKKEANEEYHRLWEEIFALEEEQMQLADAQLKDPAFDGTSPTLTKEEELAFHRANAMKEKADVLAAVYRIKEACLAGSFRPELPAGALASVLDRFAGELYALQLPELQEDWWQYQIQIRETGVSLLLVHTEILYDYAPGRRGRNVPEMVPDQAFPLHTTRAKLLTPDEFGRLHGVSSDAVLEWIKRGRVRSAIGTGRSLRIPELASVLEYEEESMAEYAWEKEFPELPDELYFLEGFRDVLICPSGEADRPWELNLSGKPKGGRILTIDNDTVEQLRLFLMAQPEVECVNNVLGEFISKAIPLPGETAERS